MPAVVEEWQDVQQVKKRGRRFELGRKIGEEGRLELRCKVSDLWLQTAQITSLTQLVSLIPENVSVQMHQHHSLSAME